MKISSKVDSNITQTEVCIIAKTESDRLEIADVLDTLDKRIVGEKNGEFRRLRFSDIYYFESVDKKTFAYTEKDVFQIMPKLYEVEKIMPSSFFRCCKAVIINLSKVESFRAAFGARLLAKLINGEKISISRLYVKDLKTKLSED